MAFEPAQERADGGGAAFGGGDDEIIHLGLDGGGGHGGNLGGGQRRGVAPFVKRDLFEGLAKIAGIECAGQGGKIGHGGGLDLGETGLFQRIFDLVARGWVVVKADADRAWVLFKQRFQRGFCGEPACGDGDLGITRFPVFQGGGDGVGQPVSGIFDKGDAGAGEKADRLDGIKERGGVFAQFGCRDAG